VLAAGVELGAGLLLLPQAARLRAITSARARARNFFILKLSFLFVFFRTGFSIIQTIFIVNRIFMQIT